MWPIKYALVEWFAKSSSGKGNKLTQNTKYNRPINQVIRAYVLATAL